MCCPYMNHSAGSDSGILRLQALAVWSPPQFPCCHLPHCRPRNLYPARSILCPCKGALTDLELNKSHCQFFNMVLRDSSKGLEDIMRISCILNDDEDDDDDTSRISEDDHIVDDATRTSRDSSLSQGEHRHLPRRLNESRCRRPPCKKYSLEQALFIWYQRTDLAKPWDEVEEDFRRQFEEKRGKGGLQCKFYRTLNDAKVEKVREQAKWGRRSKRDRVGKFGVIQRTNKRYSWMLPEDRHKPPLPCFYFNDDDFLR